MCSEVSMAWNKHQSNLVEVFKKLLDSSTLVDCTIAAEGQYLKAHKIILSACSPYFEMLFSQESEKNPIVVLKDIKFQELKALINYIYCGNVNVREEHLERFLGVAESLQIKGLGSGNRKRNISGHQATESSPLEHNKEDHVSPLRWKRLRRSYAKNKRVSVEEICLVNEVNLEKTTNKEFQSLETIVDVASSDGDSTCPLFVNLKENSVSLPLSESSGVENGPNSCEGDPSSTILIESSYALPPNECNEARDNETEESVSFPEPSLAVSERNCSSETSIAKNGSELMAEECVPDNIDSSVEQTKEEMIEETEYSETDEADGVIADDQHSSSHQDLDVQAEVLATYSQPSAEGKKQGTLMLLTGSGKLLKVHKKLGTVSFQPGAISKTGWEQKGIPRVVVVPSSEDSAQIKTPPQRHTGLKSTGSSPSKPCCFVCGKKFSSSSYLQRHILNHRDDRPFHCEVCGKSFKQLRSLKVHSTIHSDVKPYLCKLCGKNFRRNAHLQSHVYVHLGYRPHECQVCGKTYVERSNLKAHMRVHSIECQVCKKTFRQREALHAHSCEKSDETTPEVTEEG